MVCGSTTLLVDLPEDVLDIIGKSLLPRDICSITMCCKGLHSPIAFDNTWYAKCEDLAVLSSADLVEWRRAFSSYKALYKFLTCVKPLLGIWVSKNPELGNVVYVMPGFSSVVGCRIIPQKIGPLGIEGSSIQWAPVFEVISDKNGAPSFILHGRERGQDHHYIYPGKIKSIDKTCNVLLLEVNHKNKRNFFSELNIFDREELLHIITRGVGKEVSPHTSLFPCMRGDEERFLEDIAYLTERRSTLIKIHELGGGYIDWITSHNVKLDNCLSFGDKVGLTLHTSTEMGLYPRDTSFPCMDDKLFALYKLPVQLPRIGEDYGGLWGGTFGWPPGKSGEALFLFNLTYYEESGKRKLVATKILEGKDYARYPNGTNMFTVNVEEASDWTSEISVREGFTGEGDDEGGTFRYRSFKPGCLFVLEDGRLSFAWGKDEYVLTLERVELEEVLKKGERVKAIPPIPNFSYLNTCYANLFADDEKTMEIILELYPLMIDMPNKLVNGCGTTQQSNKQQCPSFLTRKSPCLICAILLLFHFVLQALPRYMANVSSR